MGRLVRLIALSPKEFQAIIYQGQIEKEPVPGQAISTVPNDLDTSFWIVPVNAGQDFMVGETILLRQLRAFGCPGADTTVVVLLAENINVMIQPSADWCRIPHYY